MTHLNLQEQGKLTDVTYAWVTQLDADRRFPVFHYGRVKGANSIYGMTITPEKTAEP